VLNGLNGRQAGSVDGFNYSDANKASGITWSEAVFKEYIKDPRTKVPGTKMVFAGIKSEKEVGDLWSYVSQFDKDGNASELMHSANRDRLENWHQLQEMAGLI